MSQHAYHYTFCDHGSRKGVSPSQIVAQLDHKTAIRLGFLPSEKIKNRYNVEIWCTPEECLRTNYSKF